MFAGFLSYTDDQINRVLDYLEESGQLDNMIIVVISDNGASGEGGPNGSVNEVKFFNGYIDSVEESLKHFDDLGGPETYNHYPIGWAMAFNTPYKLYKLYASHEGGIADTAILSWPKGIAAHGEVRDNYVNVADITPTVYDLLEITPPAIVRGVPPFRPARASASSMRRWAMRSNQCMRPLSERPQLFQRAFRAGGVLIQLGQLGARFLDHLGVGVLGELGVRQPPPQAGGAKIGFEAHAVPFASSAWALTPDQVRPASTNALPAGSTTCPSA